MHNNRLGLKADLFYYSDDMLLINFKKSVFTLWKAACSPLTSFVLVIKPLQVIDPDHPLAALVRKAQQERNGAAAMATKTEEEHQPPAIATQAEYTTDREYCLKPTGLKSFRLSRMMVKVWFWRKRHHRLVIA